MKTKFEDLNIKEKLAIISACAAFICGWLLTGIAAFVPLLLSEQSILWILGQSLTYASAVFGVSMYFSAESRNIKADITKHIAEMERLSLERQKIRSGIPTDEVPIDEDEK